MGDSRVSFPSAWGVPRCDMMFRPLSSRDRTPLGSGQVNASDLERFSPESYEQPSNDRRLASLSGREALSRAFRALSVARCSGSTCFQFAPPRALSHASLIAPSGSLPFETTVAPPFVTTGAPPHVDSGGLDHFLGLAVDPAPDLLQLPERFVDVRGELPGVRGSQGVAPAPT